MSYTATWSAPAQLMSDTPHIMKREVEQLCRSLESKNWSIVEHRQQALDEIGALHADFVVAVDVRFPAYKTYLRFSDCDLSVIMAQLEASCSYKESERIRNAPVVAAAAAARSHAAPESPPDSVYSNSGDALKAYYSAIRQLRTTINRGGCYETRETFEARLNLVWA